MNESQFLDWLRGHDPILACGADYCCTLDELRTVMNRATGLNVESDDDTSQAFDLWRSALEKRTGKH